MDISLHTSRNKESYRLPVLNIASADTLIANPKIAYTYPALIVTSDLGRGVAGGISKFYGGTTESTLNFSRTEDFYLNGRGLVSNDYTGIGCYSISTEAFTILSEGSGGIYEKIISSGLGSSEQAALLNACSVAACDSSQIITFHTPEAGYLLESGISKEVKALFPKVSIVLAA